MTSGHYCDSCHRNYQSCTCRSLDHTQSYQVFKALATKPTKEPSRSDTYGIPLEEHNAGATSVPVEKPLSITEVLKDRMKTQTERFTDMNRKFSYPYVGNIEHLGPDISGMVESYPKPLKYGWNCVNRFKPPSGKLQFYTIGGTCIYGEYSSMAPGFVTHWAYLLPSPSKQAGAIK